MSDEAATLPPRLAETLRGADATQNHPLDPGTTMGRRETVSEMPPLPRVGLSGALDVVPEYRIGEVLGRGATAVVYAAEHLPMGRTVAIKTPRPEAARPEAFAALVDEARITGGLEHPNIVPVHAVGLDVEQRPLLVMKRIDGSPWRAIMGDPEHAVWARWPGDHLDRTLQVALRVADAMAAAHARGVLHRDVKPSNVVLGMRGEVYLVDWGIAVRLGPDGRIAVPLAGTPAYMAPEMFDDNRPLDVRSDVYLLGATLYAALAGRPPRRGRSLSALAVAAHAAPPTLEGVHAELGAIVARAMDPEPARRYDSVEALRGALVDYLDHRSALQLVAQADACRARLEALGGPADPAAAPPDADRVLKARDALISEARFGYRAALTAWPDCPPARAGLEGLAEETIRADLARGDVAAARRALADLPVERPDLTAAVAAAEARQVTDRAELQEARSRAEGLDAETGRARRLRWVPWVLLLLVIGPIRMGVLRLMGRLADTQIPPVRAVAPLVIAVGIEVYIRRRPANGPGRLFNQQILRLGQACLAGIGLIWAEAWLAGRLVGSAVFSTLVLQIAVFGLGVVFVDRRFGVAVVLAAVAAVVGLVWPPVTELALGLHLIGMVLVLEPMWTRDG